jgi:hypothetical protein
VSENIFGGSIDSANAPFRWPRPKFFLQKMNLHPHPFRVHFFAAGFVARQKVFRDPICSNV